MCAIHLACQLKNSLDMDLLVPSAKELKEAKELFRQFDTDGTGMLTVEEIQVPLPDFWGS